MTLAGALDLIKMPDPISEEAKGALLDGAVLFLMSGGVLSLSDWRDLSKDERAAFHEAWKLVEADRALALALALTGPDGAAEVAKRVDGGAAADGLALDRAVEAVSASITGKELV